MSATARLIVMMEPEDKKKLVAIAKAQKLSVAKLARQRLVAPGDPSERAFLEAVVDLGEKAKRIFAQVDEREARESAAQATQPAREGAIRERVEAAFRAARARRPLEGEGTESATTRARPRP